VRCSHQVPVPGGRHRQVLQKVVGAQSGNVPPRNEPRFDSPAFDSPDNLALDRQGNLAITEDVGGTLTRGNDIWIAEPSSDDGENPGANGQPAAVVERFATLPDCAAEPSGIYFSADRTNRFRRNRQTRRRRPRPCSSTASTPGRARRLTRISR